MCVLSDKFDNHIFFFYITARYIWSLYDMWSGITLVYHNIASIHFYQFVHLGLSKVDNIYNLKIYVDDNYSEYLEV